MSQTTGKPILEVEDLRTYFYTRDGVVRSVDGVSFSVSEGEFVATNIWDSARRLESNMYRPGMMQCLSFGHGKPLQINRDGAILLDDKAAYDTIIQQRYDGRDLNCKPWESQKTFRVGYHYKPTIEEAVIGLTELEKYKINPQKPKYIEYPDLRTITITN